jgi:hypothetical protein
MKKPRQVMSRGLSVMGNPLRYALLILVPQSDPNRDGRFASVRDGSQRASNETLRNEKPRRKAGAVNIVWGTVCVTRPQRTVHLYRKPGGASVNWFT